MDRQRRLHERAAASGDHEAMARHINARLRAGELRMSRALLAGYCGHVPSALAVGGTVRPDRDRGCVCMVTGADHGAGCVLRPHRSILADHGCFDLPAWFGGLKMFDGPDSVAGYVQVLAANSVAWGVFADMAIEFGRFPSSDHGRELQAVLEASDCWLAAPTPRVASDPHPLMATEAGFERLIDDAWAHLVVERPALAVGHASAYYIGDRLVREYAAAAVIDWALR